MSARRLLLLTILILAGVALGTCAVLGMRGGWGRGSSSLVVVRFWNGFTGPDGRAMLRLVKQFNRENPDVRVLMQRMEWTTYYNKLLVAGLGERAPEVFVCHTSSLPRLVQAGFLRPIDDLMSSPDRFNLADIDANILQAVVFEGRHLAVPLDVHPLGMYFNTRLLIEAGCVDERGEPRPPTDRDGFVNTLTKLTRDADGDGRPEQWGFVFTWYRTNVFTVMRQFGGRMFTDDLSRCTLDESANVEALQFCVDLIRRYRCAAPPEGIDAWIGFRQGKVGITLEGIYMLADLQRQSDITFGGAPVPLLGKQSATWADSHTLCLRADLAGDELDAAWRFVRFLSDRSLDWAAAGQVPVRISLRQDPRFEVMPFQRHFAEQIPYVEYVPRVPFIFEFYSEFDLAVERALRGSMTPAAALGQATERLNQVIERYRRQDRGQGGAS